MYFFTFILGLISLVIQFDIFIFKNIYFYF